MHSCSNSAMHINLKTNCTFFQLKNDIVEDCEDLAMQVMVHFLLIMILLKTLKILSQNYGPIFDKEKFNENSDTCGK